MFPPAEGSLAQGVAIFNEKDVVDAVAPRHKRKTRVGGGDVVHHVLQVCAACAEAVAPCQRRVGPVDCKDNLVGTFAHPVGDFGRGDGIAHSRIGGVGIGSGYGRVHRPHAAAAHLYHIAIGHRLIRPGIPSPIAIQIIAPAAHARARVDRSVVIRHVGHQRTAHSITETAVIRHNRVQQIGGCCRPTPAHAPSQGDVVVTGVVVPIQDDDGLVRACTRPKLNVRSRECDSLGPTT